MRLTLQFSSRKQNILHFDGMHVKGTPIKTFVNGERIMDDGEIVADAGTGKIVSNISVFQG